MPFPRLTPYLAAVLPSKGIFRYLNPAPFNIKEHALIFMMANVAINPAYAMNVIVVSEKYYGYQLGLGWVVVSFYPQARLV